jgi:hypothetical protein
MREKRKKENDIDDTPGFQLQHHWYHQKDLG